MHWWHGVWGIRTWQQGGCPLLDRGKCDLVARMLRVMNVLLMQFVITQAIHGCLKTQSLLVKHRHMMHKPTRQKASVISWEKMKKTARPWLILNKIVDYIRLSQAELLTFANRFLSTSWREKCFNCSLHSLDYHIVGSYCFSLKVLTDTLS